MERGVTVIYTRKWPFKSLHPFAATVSCRSRRRRRCRCRIIRNSCFSLLSSSFRPFSFRSAFSYNNSSSSSIDVGVIHRQRRRRRRVLRADPLCLYASCVYYPAASVRTHDGWAWLCLLCITYIKVNALTR